MNALCLLLIGKERTSLEKTTSYVPRQLTPRFERKLATSKRGKKNIKTGNTTAPAVAAAWGIPFRRKERELDKPVFQGAGL